MTEATTGQRRSQEGRLTRFYREQEPHPRHGKLSDILVWDNDRLENTHDYIQWLFPLFSPSRAVPGSPTLTQADQAAFNSDPQLQARLLDSFRRILSFLGFEQQEQAGRVTLSPGPDWTARRRVWLRRDNHNYRRISRILTSLNQLGLPEQARAFFAALDELYRTPEGRQAINPDTFAHWQRAAQKETGSPE